MFKLEVKQASTASKFGMQGLTLGYLAQLGAFQEHWDGVYPEEFPFDPSVPNSKGKRLETFASYVGKEKGRQAILTKAKGVGGMSASVLESIVRVVSALPEGVEQAEQPINEMFGLLSSPDWHSLLDVTKCTENDRDITLLLLASTMTRDAIRRAPANGQAVHNNDVRYMDADVGIFTLLKSLSPEVSRRMERWGLQLSQLYIDFFRLLGEHVGCQVWEKKASVSEAQIRAIIWGLTLMTPVRLNYGAMSNLWVRSERT